VLTDYHLHLRPDEEETPPESYFTAENVDRYLAAAGVAGIEELGVSEHIHRFTQALELWRHPFWEEQARDDLDAYCEFVRGTPLRLGIECDFVPGAEDRTANLLDARDFDYVVGSVHFVGDLAVDHDGSTSGRRTTPIRCGAAYFEALSECARSGLFDILAHPDLVKVWGGGRPLPDRDPRHYYEPAVRRSPRAASRSRSRPPACASRSASSTRRRPSPRCASRRAPRSRSPRTPISRSRFGFGYDRALAFLAELGVEELAVYEGRQRRMERI